MNRFRSVISKIILLGSSLIIGLMILEIGSKIILSTTKLGQKIKYVENKLKGYRHVINSFDPDLGWGYKPNTNEDYSTSDFSITYSINSHGFRDKEISADSLLGKFRVLALGESTVFGEGLNYGRRFTEAIETSLNNVEVINMGVWGFGADQSLLQLEKYGFRFSPRSVILFVISDYLERCKLYQRLDGLKPRFVLNDKKDNLVLQDIAFIKTNFAVTMQPKRSKHRLEDIPVKSIQQFLERSSLFTLLNGKKKMLEINKKIANVDRRHWQGIYGQLKEDFKRGITYEDEDFKRLVFLILKQYQEVCARNSADFILVYIGMNKEYFSRWLANPIKNLSIDCLDLSGVLCEASKKNPLRFNIDPHYNAFTHRIIGEQVSDYLAKKYNLPRNKDDKSKETRDGS